MDEIKLIKYEHGQLQRVRNAIAITNKLLQTNSKLEEAIDTEKNANYYFDQGREKSYSKKFVEAILDYDKAIHIDPNYSFAFEKRGLAKSDLGDYEGAILDYNKSIETGGVPPFYWVYILRGIAEINLGRLEEAIIDFNKATEIEPDHPHPYNHRGYVKEKLGKIKEAKLDYEKAIELDPSYKDAKENLLRLKSKI